MKKAIYFICYLVAFCVGILLLILNQQASVVDNSFLHYIFISVGIVFIIPGVSILFTNLFNNGNINQNNISNSWASTLTGIISLIWGVLILIMPSGLFGNLNITLGISIIILAIAQVTWITKGKDKNGAPFWLYIIPVIVAAAGIAVLLLKKDFQNPGRELETGCIISGIALLLWCTNGFLSIPRRKKTEAELVMEEKKIQRDQKKLRKKGKENKTQTKIPHTENENTIE